MRFTARNDYAFKKLFGTEENKDIMIEFISLVTLLNQDDFDDVRIENSEQIPLFYNEKAGRLDIKIRLNDGRKIDVEMQNTYFNYYPKRSIFYCSKMLHEHFPSGLQYTVLTEGTGAQPKATDQVKCHYEGRLIDETVFDSSYQRGEPAVFPLNGVIAGWTEGVQLMKEGAKYRFFIPYNLAYGERGAGNSIPPYAALVFDVELIKVM